MIRQNYSYALDENNNLIHVKMAVRGKIYRCPFCGEEMTPHMGEIRKWHFTHKANLQNCSYETYLHKIAKARIKEAFLSNTQFYISYDVPVYCKNKPVCKIYCDSRCTDTQILEYDLKEFYDSCHEEAPYKNFRADLMLTSPKHKGDPILIEILVSHKSTDEKKKDKVRIIEVEIKSEEDIDKICSERLIEGKRESDSYYSRDEKPKNIFYNFDRNHPISPTQFTHEPYKHVFWIKESGEFCSKKYLCSEKFENFIPKDAHYIISNESVDFTWAMLEFCSRGVNFKNCLICKYMKRIDFYDERLCTLYKKFNLPKCPPTKCASECPYFRRIENSKEKPDFQFTKHHIVIREK